MGPGPDGGGSRHGCGASGRRVGPDQGRGAAGSTHRHRALLARAGMPGRADHAARPGGLLSLRTLVRMPVTTGLNHVATGTADLDRLTRFYAEAFDAVVTFEMARTDDHPRMAILDLGGGAALNAFEVPEESL